MKNRLARNAIALWLVQVVNYVVPFLILVHLTKTLGVDKFGVLAFSQGIIALCFVVVDFGYGLSATNKISINRLNKRYVEKLVSGIFVVKIVLYLVCCCVVVVYSLLTDKYGEHWRLFVFSLLPIATQGFLPSWLFHGIERMAFAAVGAIASKMLFALLVIFYVDSPEDYIFVPVFSALGDLLAIVISIYFIYNLGYRIGTPTQRWIKYCWKISVHFFISRVAVASYMNGGVVVLGLFAQPAVVAIYSMAEQLYKAMQAALGPAAAVAYPYMAKEKNITLMVKLFFGVVVFACISAITGYILAPRLVPLVFDDSWLVSISVLNVFFVAIVVHAAAIMAGYPLASIVGRVDVANSSVVTGAFVYFLMLLIVFLFDFIAPKTLAAIMIVSELSVLLHRSSVLLPLVIKSNRLIGFKQGKS
jgi:PST family polysaccharide transporter